jgi:hypothetical protein
MVAAAVLAMFSVAQGRALADQAGCQVGNASPQEAWGQGPQTITVSVDLDSTVFSAVQNAFTAWESSPAGKAAQVHFSLQQVPAGGTATGQYVIEEDHLPPDPVTGLIPAAGTSPVPTPQVDRTSATTILNLDSGLDFNDPTTVNRIMAHEIGHTYGLPDATFDAAGLNCQPGTSVMNPLDANNIAASLTGPTADDSSKVLAGDGYVAPTPPPVGRHCFVDTNPCCTDPSDPECTPIILDVDGSGFQLTSAAHGVWFDFFGNHHPVKLAWTAPGSTDAFLVLPQHGKVTYGRDLFGNLTPQPRSAHPNGFLALATYATLGVNGRRSDVIDSDDPIYARLRLWQFSNQGGRLVAGKLSTLPQLGITAIYLNYRATTITDRYGNAFRYAARVISTNPHAGKYAYDVFLQAAGAASAQRATAASRPATSITLGLLALLPVVLLLAGWQLIRHRRHRPAHPAGKDAGDLQPSAAERQPEPAARP